MNRAIAVVLGWLLAATIACAQQAPAKVNQPWFMLGRLASAISVTTSSAAAQITSPGLVAWICNTGAVDAYLTLGTANTVNTGVTTGDYLKAGTCGAYDLYPIGQVGTPYTWIALIGSGGSTTVTIETGVGQPPASSSAIVSGTVAATQGATPWVDSVTQWGGGTLGAMANYGTSPGAVLAPGVNAYVTNTPSTVVQGQAAAPRNFPGCTVGTVSASCLAGSTATQYLQIQNTSASVSIACRFGGAAALNSATSIQLAPGQPASWGPMTAGVPTGQLNCIAGSASTPLYVEWL